MPHPRLEVCLIVLLFRYQLKATCIWDFKSVKDVSSSFPESWIKPGAATTDKNLSKWNFRDWNNDPI